VAEELEIAAAQLMVSIAEAKNEPVDQWVRDLSLEAPNGHPAFANAAAPEATQAPPPAPEVPNPAEQVSAIVNMGMQNWLSVIAKQATSITSRDRTFGSFTSNTQAGAIRESARRIRSRSGEITAVGMDMQPPLRTYHPTGRSTARRGSAEYAVTKRNGHIDVRGPENTSNPDQWVARFDEGAPRIGRTMSFGHLLEEPINPDNSTPPAVG
jgi:hypothetical protein